MTQPSPTPQPTRRRSPVLRPTRLGVAFLGLTLLTLVGCINYGLSLGYGLTFLLGGIWIVTAAMVTRAARTLRLTMQAPADAVAGRPLSFAVQVTQEGAGSFVYLTAQFTQAGQTRRLVGGGYALSGEGASGVLTVASPVRGPLRLSHVQIAAVDPLGLWHASYAQTDLPAEATEVLVAPAPEVDAPPPLTQLAAGSGETAQRVPGFDEFAGVRPYIAGDAPRLISWKHAARTGTLMTREYDAPAGQGLLLDWQATNAAGDTEARLSRMAAWVMAARDSGTPFAFQMPAVTLPAAAGEAQARAALRALATFAPFPVPAAVAPRPRQDFWGRQIGEALPALPAAPLRFSLLAMGFSLLPLVFRAPFWVSLLMGGVLVYAYLAANAATAPAETRRRFPPLPMWALALLAVAGAGGLVAQYGTLLGVDAGTAILGILLAIKAAETRTVRDAKLLSLLAIFMTSTNYFDNQGPLTALHSVLALWLALAALPRWILSPALLPITTPTVTQPRPLLRLTGQMLLLALPLAALLFAFFPRPDGPLWRLPLQGGNQTGLADSITAGEFSNLAQSNAVAFRADFGGGPMPSPDELYWRGPVYEAYDGLRWTQIRARFAEPSLSAVPKAPIYSYSLTLEPNGKPWLLALDTPLTLPANAILTSGFQALSLRPASLRTRYELRSQAANMGVSESVERLNNDLKLPAGQSPQALALAQGWRTLAPEQRVQAALAYFAKGGFSYSLNAPTLPENNRVDAFLFGSKQGFCEHYSSAFAFLMRAAGIPTRIVGGYQGGELNPDGNYLIVRQQNAHAWDEVWIQGEGWVRVDPTAVVAPARISTDLGTALSAPNATSAKPRTSLEQLRLRLDTFQNDWNNWVITFNGEQQRNLLSRLGISGVGSAPYMLALAGGVLLLLLPIFALVRRAARPRDPALAALHDLSERLGLPRTAGETATHYATRAAQTAPQQRERLNEIAALFNQIRYAPAGASAEAVRQLQGLVRQVRRGQHEKKG